MSSNIRKAIVRKQADKVDAIRRYMPSNYSAAVVGEDVVLTGKDSAGWTLEDYVIPRLASGLYFAEVLDFDTLRDKIAFEKAERAARYAEFDALVREARVAAQAAGEAVEIAPSIVGTAIGLSDVIDTTKPMYYDTAGVCGFAWVEVRPGSCSFARWLVKMGFASAAYRGGVRIRMSGFGQSYERKMAAAQAFAGVLKDSPLLEGVRIYPGGRLD